MAGEAGSDVNLEGSDTMADINETAAAETTASVIHPYGFVAEDWYWMVKMAWV